MTPILLALIAAAFATAFVVAFAELSERISPACWRGLEQITGERA